MLRLIGTYNIPEWAICYLANGDRDNLTDEEVADIEKFCDKILNSEPDIKGVIWDFDVMDEEKYGNYYVNEMDSRPAIGPSIYTKTYDIPCWVEYSGEDVKQTEFDIVVTSDNYGATRIFVFVKKPFIDAEEAELWVETYFKHYGFGFDYKIFPSSTNIVCWECCGKELPS